MTSISNFIMKKSIAVGGKPKKKSIPININSNPAPGKFLISNQINSIASSYLTMGQKIQISKNAKTSKIIHVNTTSPMNYYSLNSKDLKVTNGSLTNNVFNKYQSNNISENHGINFNNFYNNNNSQLNYEGNSIEKNIIKYNNLNINSKVKNQISSISNSLLSNDFLTNGYQTSKNINNSNLITNNSKPKNRIISTNSKTNISKIRQTYSSRVNFLDSRNKTKKVAMKSKIRQYKYQYKNRKPVSTSFSNVHIIKNNIQGSVPKNICNYVRGDLNNLINENNYDNIFVKSNTNGNYIINNNLYEDKNRHFRHNTASFDNKDIISIFNKNNFLDNKNKNINNLNIKNVNNIGIGSGIKHINSNICINNINSNTNININQIKNLNNKNNNNINNEYNINSNKINNGNINKRKAGQYSKGKISDIKIYVNEKRLNQKDNKYLHNLNTNNVLYSKNNNNNVYHNYYSNNTNMGKDNNNCSHHFKNSHSIYMNIAEKKIICVKQKEVKKNNNIIPNQNKITKQIPNLVQKTKGNIPSQRNIKINLAKFLEDVKNKQNNKLVMVRKSLSIKRKVKENNSDFSLSQLNEKYTQKILKNNDEGNDIENYIINNNQNINKTIQEEIKIKKIDEKKNGNNLNDIDNNILIDTNYISNIQNKANAKRISSIPTNIINENSQNNTNIYSNNINYNKLNYNNNSSTNNYNYFGKNKNDYSLDNIIELNSNIAYNKSFLKNKENVNELNINNVTDIEKQSLNNNIKNLNEKNKNQNVNNKKPYCINKLSSEKIQTNSVNVDVNISKTTDIKCDDLNTKKKDGKIINNNLFDEDNLEDFPEDYDENFNDLYSIINKMNFGNVLICVEGLFTPEGRIYKKYKEKFDKYYDKIYSKKGNSFDNSNNKPKKVTEGMSMTSNTKTNSSSSKKNIINPMYNDLNIIKDLNVY